MIVSIKAKITSEDLMECHKQVELLLASEEFDNEDKTSFFVLEMIEVLARSKREDEYIHGVLSVIMKNAIILRKHYINE